MKVFIGIIAVLIATNINQACVIKGKKYEHGDTWITNNFEHECIKRRDGSWRTKITACLARGGFRIRLGTVFTESGMKYSCLEKSNGTVVFAYMPA